MSEGVCSIFRYDRPSFPDVFNEATSIVDKVFWDDDVLFSICDPIASQFPSYKSVGLQPYSRDEVIGKVPKVLNFGFPVTQKADKSTFMQLQPFDNTLHTNPQFFCYSEENETEHTRCLINLIEKLIHEIFHGLTNTFFELKGMPSISERDENNN